MSNLKPGSYWQQKATYKNLADTIPGFEDIEPGRSMIFVDEKGDPSLEVRVSPNSVFVSQFAGVVDYMESLIRDKPSNQIIQESSPQELTALALYAVLDCVCRCMLDSGQGLNDLLNNHNDVEIIDYKNHEIHNFSGTMKNQQLAFEVSKPLDAKLPKTGRLKEGRTSEYNVSFTDFLGKLSGDLKPRLEAFRAIELS